MLGIIGAHDAARVCARPLVKVLLTGGAGYIGSTVASACLDAGHTPVILDDLSTGARAFTAGRIFYRGDIADGDLLARVFAQHPEIAATIHCAAHIVVPESVADPLGYYRNNVSKTVELIGQLSTLGCRRLVFSSSAAIYAPSDDFAVDEHSPLAPGTPYARTKAMVEQVLADAAAAGLIRGLSLRYFNPVGADPSLRTGQPASEPSDVLGRMVGAGLARQPFTVTGTDWPTRDGTGIRDYVHVWDLARAHVAAIERFDDALDPASGFGVVNVGTGRGTTVRELAREFEQACGSRLEVVDGPRRPGDVVGGFARVDRAGAVLGWRSELTITEAIRHALAWAAVRDDVLAGYAGAR